ncbi:peptidase S8/S53 domain-containing protein, partial [Bombardia bombarda]
SSSTWGQARLSHRNSSTPDTNYSYLYERGGATVYIIDTGVRISHAEFTTTSPLIPASRAAAASPSSARVSLGGNFVTGSTNASDQMGHGTHVAGTIGGLTRGISPSSRLVSLKVFGGDDEPGSWDYMLAALQYAVDDAVARNATGLSVVNISAGGDRWDPIDEAVTSAVARGVAVVVAAGNDGRSADGASPARCPDAITVGAIDAADRRPDFSNWGPGLAVFAPGVDVESADYRGDGGVWKLSGTSMSAPHVTGLVAYFMELYGWHTPEEMRKRIVGLATRGLVVDAGEGSPNLIAFNG